MGAPLEDLMSWPEPEPAGLRSAPAPERHTGSQTLTYRPVMDVARGVAAGFAATPTAHTEQPLLDAAEVASALSEQPNLPSNTFLSVPVDADDIGTTVRTELMRVDSLSGIVVEVGGRRRLPDLRAVANEIRGAGGTLALSGGESGQPALAAIVNLRPSIITLGRDWIRNIENSTRKQLMLESVGRLASAQDAWILAEDVRSDAELRTLAELGVPLAVGPFVGGPSHDWPAVDLAAVAAVPGRHRERGPLRDLLRPVLTVRSLAEAAALASNLDAGDHLVVVESDGRPRALVRLNRGRIESYEILSVNVGTSVGEALHRAQARVEDERWLPVAVTDDTGGFLGLISIDTLRD